MGFVLFVLFVGIPVLEISIFISIGSTIGLWPTLITIFSTAFIGAIVIRKQGLETLFSVQKNFNDGHLPLTDIFDGLCLVISGVFLITPGFLTDGVGFLFLFPLFRNLLKKVISNVFMTHATAHVYSSTENTNQTGYTKPTIDGEFEVVHPNDKRKNPQALK